MAKKYHVTTQGEGKVLLRVIEDVPVIEAHDNLEHARECAKQLSIEDPPVPLYVVMIPSGDQTYYAIMNYVQALREVDYGKESNRILALFRKGEELSLLRAEQFED